MTEQWKKANHCDNWPEVGITPFTLCRELEEALLLSNTCAVEDEQCVVALCLKMGIQQSVIDGSRVGVPGTAELVSLLDEKIERLTKERDLATARLEFLTKRAWRTPASWGDKPASWHLSFNFPGDDSVHDRLPHDFLAAVDAVIASKKLVTQVV